MISALSGDHEAPTGQARADQHLYAQFARDAYRKQGVPHYKLIAENRAGPTGNMRAYRKRTGAGPVVIAFRGTQVEEDLRADLRADYAVLTGTEAEHERFAEADRFYNEVRARVGGAEVVVTGHSLGGALAAHVARLHPETRAYTFNQGAGLGSLTRAGDTSNVVVYTTGNDPLSWASMAQKTTGATVYVVPVTGQGLLETHRPAVFLDELAALRRLLVHDLM